MLLPDTGPLSFRQLCYRLFESVGQGSSRHLDCLYTFEKFVFPITHPVSRPPHSSTMAVFQAFSKLPLDVLTQICEQASLYGPDLTMNVC
jgi:hypothetical protein